MARAKSELTLTGSSEAVEAIFALSAPIKRGCDAPSVIHVWCRVDRGHRRRAPPKPVRMGRCWLTSVFVDDVASVSTLGTSPHHQGCARGRVRGVQQSRSTGDRGISHRNPFSTVVLCISSAVILRVPIVGENHLIQFSLLHSRVALSGSWIGAQPKGLGGVGNGVAVPLHSAIGLAPVKERGKGA
jgi:hypothetical protein